MVLGACNLQKVKKKVKRSKISHKASICPPKLEKPKLAQVNFKVMGGERT